MLLINSANDSNLPRNLIMVLYASMIELVLGDLLDASIFVHKPFKSHVSFVSSGLYKIKVLPTYSIECTCFWSA